MKLKKSDIKKLNDKLNTLEHLLKNAGFDGSKWKTYIRSRIKFKQAIERIRILSPSEWLPPLGLAIMYL